MHDRLLGLSQVALLLGVRVSFGTPLADLADLRTFLRSTRSAEASLQPPKAPTREAAEPAPDGASGAAVPAVLVDATGARCGLFSAIGFEQQTVLRSARALGIVVHLFNRKTAEEVRIAESNAVWSLRAAKLCRLGGSVQ